MCVNVYECAHMCMCRCSYVPGGGGRGLKVGVAVFP